MSNNRIIHARRASEDETPRSGTWRLRLEGPGYAGVLYELSEGETLLGRSDGNHIVLSGSYVSRRHARIVVSKAGVTCEDLRSRNGTWVNGERCDERVPLQSGDVLRIGEYQLELEQIGVPVEEGETVYRAPIREVALASRLRGALRAERGERIERSGLDPLALVCQVSERLSRAKSLRAFLEDVAALSLDLANARTVAILLFGEQGQLEPWAVQHRGELHEGELPISSSIVESAIRDRSAICVADASSDQRFAARESIARYQVAQVICIPLSQDDGEVLGAIYLNRHGSAKELVHLVEALTAIAHLTASGVEHQRMRDRAEREMLLRRSLERFLAPDVVDRVTDGGESLQMEERWGTVLFADISGFTQLTERRKAEEVVGLLDEFYRRMTEIVFQHGGTVDKFIGDAIMAIFGVPYAYGDDAARALQAAHVMERQFAAMMTERATEEGCRLKVGIHAGSMLAGTVGGDHRLEYTAIGDTVNVAARLVEGAEPGQILVSAAALEAAGPARFPAVELGSRKLRGRSETVEVYNLLPLGATAEAVGT